MNISGLQKTTLLDYPGHVAATIFLGGCNFRCPFCHNMNIVKGIETEIIENDEVMLFLNKRAGVLDGVCITGGEPTIYNDLPDFIKRIKKIEKPNGNKYLVKLDTNGTNPEMLEKLLADELIDYIAMDIKASEEKYALVSGLSMRSDSNEEKELINTIKKSIYIIMNSGIDYEFRTTIVSQFHDEETVHGVGKLIKGAKAHFLQSFTDSEYIEDHNLTAVDKETIYKYADIMNKYVQTASVRGVD